nr:hypothetical protein [Tanacetum cinerariifolium]
MARLAFCDYHNMVAILEKSEHNVDFHQIVDFVEASPLRYALTFKPTVYVSHIRQFWSTARIETTEEGTKILATVDGILRTISESSIRRNLKLKDEAGISSLSDAEIFENLTLMGYNISLNQKFTFQKIQFSHQWKYLIHTIMQCLSPKSIGFNEFSSNIVTALVCLATNMVYNFSKMIFMVWQYTRRARIAQSSAPPPVADEPASPLRDVSQGEACPTVSSFEAEHDRANIAKTSTLPHESTSRVPSLAVDKGKRSGDDAPIKGMRLDEGDEAAEKGSNDTEEMINVLTSMDAATVLSSGVAEVPTGSSSIPTAGPPTTGVPTGSYVVPTATLIFATVTVVTPYTRRKGKEKMIKSKTPKKKKIQEQMDIQMARQLEEEMERDAQRMNEQIARDAEISRIHAEEELQVMIDGLDRSNETVAKYQDNYAKVHKYQTQQRKPLTKKQQREFYTSVLRNQAGWKAKDFKGMTLKEIKENFDPVWKQIHDFIPIGSKEEAERFKRKGIRFEQESVKKLKTSEEVKATKEVPEEKLKEMMQLVPVEEVYVKALQVKHPIIDWKVHTEGQRSYWKITKLGGSSASYQFFVDMLKHLDREDLNQLWRLVKETLSIRPPTSDKEMELWVELKRLYEPDAEDQLWTHTQNIMHAPVEWKLYDSCRVHHVTFKDKEIFMLVEKNYPLIKGLAIMMISYKIQVENYSQMAIIEFPLPEEVPTASEESFHCQKKRDATAVKIRTATKVKKACCGVLRFIMENEAKGYEFWSTARIETTDEGTKILATVDGIFRTITESSIRHNLKLNDKEGLTSVSLEDLEIIQEEDTYTSKNTRFDHDEDDQEIDEPQSDINFIRRSTRTRRAPNRMYLYVDAEEHELGDLNEPANYKAALSDLKFDKWLATMNEKKCNP